MDFKISLIIIFLIRILLFNLQSFHIDMSDWEAWSYRLVSLGLSNFYSANYFVDYFPGYLYLLWIIGNIYHLILPNLSFASFTFEIIIKFVTTLFDFGTALYIYKIINRYNKKFSKITALIYLLNPAVIFNSSVWGQIDGISTFFLVYCAYLLTELKKPFKASFVSSISVLIKPQSLALYPVMLLNNFKSFKKNLPIVISIIVLTPFILSTPFFTSDPIFGLLNLSKSSINTYPFNSLFAFNFWGIFGWWQNDNITFLNVSYKAWGIILYTIFLFPIAYPLIKNKLTPQKLYVSYSLSFLVFYVFLTRMHERYLFPFLAFILIASFINKSRLLIWNYFLISIVHFINLWYVYYFYNFVYNNPNTDNNTLYIFYRFIENNGKVFALSVVLSFILLLVFYYRLIYAKIHK